MKCIQQSVAREVEVKGNFKLFSNSGNLVNLAKSILNSMKARKSAIFRFLQSVFSFVQRIFSFV